MASFRQEGLDTKSAARAAGNVQYIQRFNRQLKQVDPAIRLSREQLFQLDEIHEAIEAHLLEKRRGYYPLAQFFHDFSGAAKSNSYINLGSERFLAGFIRSVFLQKRFSRRAADAFLEVIPFSIARKTSGKNGSKFFERIRREGERSLHTVENEQRGVKFVFEEILGTNIFGEEEEGGSRHFLDKTLAPLFEPLSKDEETALRKKIRNFDQKSRAVQERIIQEIQFNRVTDKIADYFTQKVDELREIAEVGIRLYGEKDSRRLRYDYANWILRLLKRPGNRKFLARVVIDWYRTQQ